MKEIVKSKKFSEATIEKLRNEISSKPNIKKHEEFCIYTTGSYGRNEAGKRSDIDLFFINLEEVSISKIDKILIDADLINITKKLKFPEFSGDGEYLEIHNISNITEELGSRTDDYKNYFTARMLLLLESKCIYNDYVYDIIIDRILDKYYVDFNENENFHPMFLVNDVIRFWRTLCLNYEYARNRKESNEENKIKAHIKNYKLKFSRKLTCFSLLLSILFFKSDNLTKENIKDIIKLTPLDRLDKIKSDYSTEEDIVNKIDEIKKLYNIFLETSHQEENILKEIFKNKKKKDKKFDNARKFSRAIFELIMIKKDSGKIMYMLV